MKIIKKITAVVLAAATVTALSVAAAAYGSLETIYNTDYGTLTGETTVSYVSYYVYFTTTTSTTQTAAQLRASLRVRNEDTNKVVYERNNVTEYNKKQVTCESPGLSNNAGYSSYSTNSLYGGEGKIIAYVHTSKNS